MVVEAVLWASLSVVGARTFLVIDGVLDANGYQGVVTRVARRRRPPEAAEDQRGFPSSCRSATQEPRRGTAGGRFLSRFRFIHVRLLAMHVMSTVAHVAGVAKYTIPASDASCLVTHRLMLAFLIFYDASLVLFLLAKTDVIGSKGKKGNLLCYERAIRWWSLFWGWGYLPVVAVYLGLTFPGGKSSDGKSCFNGIESEVYESGNTGGYLIANTIMMIELMLLLGLFVKPLQEVRQRSSSATSAAVYHRLIMRSIICTVGMLLAYFMGTVMVVTALTSMADEKQAAAFADATPLVQSTITLFLTEITLPIGMTSCYRAWTGTGDERAQSGYAKIDVLSLISGGQSQGTSSQLPIKVVPCEETKSTEGNAQVLETPASSTAPNIISCRSDAVNTHPERAKHVASSCS